MGEYYEIIVSGLVQGVGFRYSVKQLADSVQLIGTVENLPNGTVRIRLHTSKETLSEFISRLEQGQSIYKIEDIQTSEVEPFSPPSKFAIIT